MLNHHNQNYQNEDYFNKIYVVFLIFHYINILKKNNNITRSWKF